MTKILYNPFESHSEKQLLIFGLAITIIGSLLAIPFDTRFDGMFDSHFSKNVGYLPFLDNLIAISCSLIVLFFAGKIINPKTRVIDIANTSIIARTPLYLTSFFNVGGFLGEVTEKLMQSTTPADIDAISGQDLLLLTAVGLLGIILLIWHFLLLWNGFKVATNARGGKHILLFVVAILVGEAISKIIFMFL